MEIEFEQAGLRFDGRVAVEPLTLRLTEKRIAVIGLNGSGKTSFSRMINGLLKPSEGRVTVNGLDTSTDSDRVRTLVGFIFQNPQNQIILPILREDIALGLKGLKLPPGELDHRVDGILRRFGIEHLGPRRAHELSGGELQLAALASVLVTEPELVILDEPTNQLDLRNRSLIERTIAGLPQSTIVVSHDLDLIRDSERVLVFHKGRLACDDAPSPAIARYRELAA